MCDPEARELESNTFGFLHQPTLDYAVQRVGEGAIATSALITRECARWTAIANNPQLSDLEREAAKGANLAVLQMGEAFQHILNGIGAALDPDHLN